MVKNWRRNTKRGNENWEDWRYSLIWEWILEIEIVKRYQLLAIAWLRY